jgi:hypothetical protein
MFGCLSSISFYTLLAGYLLATFGYVFAISESLTLERTDDVFLLGDGVYDSPVEKEDKQPVEP